jgi:hypothetical protein
VGGASTPPTRDVTRGWIPPVRRVPQGVMDSRAFPLKRKWCVFVSVFGGFSVHGFHQWFSNSELSN